MQRLLAGLMIAVGWTMGLSAAEQLPNLAEKPAKPRFEITDRIWPSEPGQAHLCLWRGDALCALSITIDDNTQPDHDWWVEQGEKYGWRFTWFVITGRLGSNGGYFGDWKDFQRLADMGHDVQSHTVTHLHMEQSQGIEWEYAESRRQLEEHFPGRKAWVLAYPGGKNSKLNDRNVAAKYYLAARGTSGHPNPANRIDYLSTNSVGRITLDDPKASWADFRNVLERNERDPRNFRAWYSVHCHGMKAPLRAEFGERFAFIKEHEADIWVGLWREVAQYGQERDTATLEAGELRDGRMTLTLTDRMADDRFDQPLTIKVRLPDGTREAAAVQSGKVLDVAIVTHDGAPYALIPVTPDRGSVTVSMK